MFSGLRNLVDRASSAYYGPSPEEKKAEYMGNLARVLLNTRDGEQEEGIRELLSNTEQFNALTEEDLVTIVVQSLAPIQLAASLGDRETAKRVYNATIKFVTADYGEFPECGSFHGNLLKIFNKMDIEQLMNVLNASSREEDPRMAVLIGRLPIDKRADLAIEMLNESPLEEGRLTLAKDLLKGDEEDFRTDLSHLGKGKLFPIYLRACELGDVELVRGIKGFCTLKMRLGGTAHYVDGFVVACKENKPEVASELLDPEGYGLVSTHGVVNAHVKGQFDEGVEEAVQADHAEVIEVLKVGHPQKCFLAACKYGKIDLVGGLIEGLKSDADLMERGLSFARAHDQQEIIDLIIDHTDADSPITGCARKAMYSHSCLYYPLKFLGWAAEGFMNGVRYLFRASPVIRISSPVERINRVASSALSRFSGSLGRAFSMFC